MLPTRDEKSGKRVLPDLLRPGLRLVFCGTAAGSRSAAVGQYYVHPGNKFWRTLFAVGLTDHLLRPSEYRKLGAYGIGLTDLSKNHKGMDHQLPTGALTADRLRALIQRRRPAFLAFNGKTAAQIFLSRSEVDFGPQQDRLGETEIFVLPSTSGAANKYWSAEPWQRLAWSMQQYSVCEES